MSNDVERPDPRWAEVYASISPYSMRGHFDELDVTEWLQISVTVPTIHKGIFIQRNEVVWVGENIDRAMNDLIAVIDDWLDMYEMYTKAESED